MQSGNASASRNRRANENENAPDRNRSAKMKKHGADQLPAEKQQQKKKRQTTLTQLTGYAKEKPTKKHKKKKQKRTKKKQKRTKKQKKKQKKKKQKPSSDAVHNAARTATECIDAALAPYGLCSHDVGAEGDCQFRALAHFLLGDAERHAEVRAAVVEELRAHPERYKPFVDDWNLDVADGHPKSYASFVDRMTKQGTWGGHATLQAAATVYRRTLHVVRSSLSPDSPSYCREVTPQAADDTTEPDDNLEGTTTIWLAYMNGNHYRATRPLDAGSGAIVATKKQKPRKKQKKKQGKRRERKKEKRRKGKEGRNEPHRRIVEGAGSSSADLAAAFPGGAYSCQFDLPASAADRLTIAGLYPPADSVTGKQHDNITSARLQARLGHDRFDWVDAVPWAPNGLCKDVDLHTLEKYIKSDRSVQESLKTRVDDRSECRVVYAAGKAMSFVAEKLWNLCAVDPSWGIYRDEERRRWFVVGRKHPTAHLYSSKADDRKEAQTTACICNVLMQLEPRSTSDAAVSDAVNAVVDAREKDRAAAWKHLGERLGPLPPEADRFRAVVQTERVESMSTLLAALPATAWNHVPLFRMADSAWCAERHDLLKCLGKEKLDFSPDQIASICCSSFFAADKDKAFDLLQILKKLKFNADQIASICCSSFFAADKDKAFD